MIKSYLHRYEYNLDKPEDKAKYEQLVERLSKDREIFKVIADKEGPPEGPITIETDLLFSNQYNTEEGFRVFDWFEKALFYNGRENLMYRVGYWIDLPEELKEAKKRQHGCGYCGARYDGKPQEFCTKCIGSEYLEESEIHLLRLKTVELSWPEREKLTEEESAALLPEYREKQLAERTKRLERNIANKKSDLEKNLRQAQIEHGGMLWLINHGQDVENVIYYNHTGKFCCGWRKALSSEEKSKILDLVSEFPFEYEIKDKPSF
jgi:hypothetical protein